MPQFAKAMFAKVANLSEEELDEIDAMSDAEIDTRITEAKTVLDGIEWRKRMRQTPFERRQARLFETNDATKELTLNEDEKVIIDRVPPKVRRDIAARGF